jgi:hypothetical protein
LGSFPITGYQIQISANSGPFAVFIADTTSTATNQGITGLMMTTDYAFKVTNCCLKLAFTFVFRVFTAQSLERVVLSHRSFPRMFCSFDVSHGMLKSVQVAAISSAGMGAFSPASSTVTTRKRATNTL